METAVIALAALACPVGMAAMGWYMVKGMRNPGPAEPIDVDDLRAEQRRLGAEIDRLDAADRDELPAAHR